MWQFVSELLRKGGMMDAPDQCQHENAFFINDDCEEYVLVTLRCVDCGHEDWHADSLNKRFGLTNPWAESLLILQSRANQ
jgi:hypothetical protein